MVCLFRRTHCAPVSDPLDLLLTIQHTAIIETPHTCTQHTTGSPYRTSYPVVSYSPVRGFCDRVAARETSDRQIQ